MLASQQPTETEPILREFLTIREKAIPNPGTPGLFNTKSVFGKALAGQKKFQEAELLLVEGYFGMKARAAQIPPAAQPRLAEAIRRLVDLYTAWDKADEAAKWQEILKKEQQ